MRQSLIAFRVTSADPTVCTQLSTPSPCPSELAPSWEPGATAEEWEAYVPDAGDGGAGPEAEVQVPEAVGVGAVPDTEVYVPDAGAAGAGPDTEAHVLGAVGDGGPSTGVPSVPAPSDNEPPAPLWLLLDAAADTTSAQDPQTSTGGAYQVLRAVALTQSGRGIPAKCTLVNRATG